MAGLNMFESAQITTLTLDSGETAKHKNKLLKFQCNWQTQKIYLRRQTDYNKHNRNKSTDSNWKPFESKKQPLSKSHSPRLNICIAEGDEPDDVISLSPIAIDTIYFVSVSFYGSSLSNSFFTFEYHWTPSSLFNPISTVEI